MCSADRKYRNMTRCDSKRQKSTRVFQQHSNEPFQAAENCAMNYHWRLTGTISTRVLQAKLSGQLKIQLNGTTLMVATKGICV